jgi:eukaryotic-like serine/threonine-protein kinase
MPSTIPIVHQLLARMRTGGDFPAMARTVGLISQLTSSVATSNSELADTILQDYGLTQKILRIVNTVAYAHYDQVTTISRAVLLMGFDRIRAVATGLILFEHLQAQAKTGALADAVNMSFFSAVLGRTIAERASFADPEEAFIGSLFHNLGRTLVALYLPDRHAAVLAWREGEPERAPQAVLGASYATIGVGVAEALSLPEKIVRSVQRVVGAEARSSMTDAEKLACVATLANDITDVLAGPGEGREKQAGIARLVRSYGPHFAAIEGTTVDVVGHVLKVLRENSNLFSLDLPGSSFLNGLGEWRIASLVGGSADSVAAEVTGTGALASTGVEADSPEEILTRGMHEITSLLLAGSSLDDVLRVVLETIYRALGVGRARVFFLIRDPAAPLARFRFGFGQAPSEMKAWFEVPVGGTDDLFGLAMRQQKDLVVRDLSAPEVAPLVPAWYRQRLIPGRSVILLPLVLDERAVGLFYVDAETTQASPLSGTMINYLKVLRGQAALAIQQRSRPQDRKR